MKKENIYQVSTFEFGTIKEWLKVIDDQEYIEDIHQSKSYYFEKI